MGRKKRSKRDIWHRRNRRKQMKTQMNLIYETEQAMKYVNNFSNRKLSDVEYRALGKGLKFCPTPPKKHAFTYLRSSFREMRRKMRCTYHFSEPGDNSPLHPLWESSGYQPDKGSHGMETYFHNTWQELCKIKRRPVMNNMPDDERQAIAHLNQDDSIIFKKADKNSNVVLLNKTDYLAEGYRQLGKTTHYEKIENTSPREVQRQIMRVVNEMKVRDQLDKASTKFLERTVEDGKLGAFYTLQKIHKLTADELIRMEHEGLKGKLIPGRPIISQIGTPTERAAKFIDLHLLPLVQVQDTYIRDTPDFIRQIEGLRVPPGAFLVSYDIESMYSNLPHEEIKQAVKEALPNKVYTAPLAPVDRQYIISLLDIILKNNVFEFNGDMYRQKVGVAMGSKMSPEAADITMHKILKEILRTSKHTNKILWQGRYRDDGFQIWNAPREEIEEFFEVANTRHPFIKFVSVIHQEEMIFLDTVIYKGNRYKQAGILDVRTYRKPTESFQLLRADSAHPQHVMSALVKGEVNRLVRTNSDPLNLTNEINFFTDKLEERKHERRAIQTLSHEVTCKNREDLLRDRPKKSGAVPLVMILPFSPHRQNIKRALTKHFPELQRDPESAGLFPEPPLMAYQRVKNIGDMILHTRTPATAFP